MPRSKPPFRADHVGSLLRPPALKQAREQFTRGEISAADLAAVEDREIAAAIRKQEEVGLQGITDGEFRRSWWHLDFLAGLDGAEHFKLNRGISFAGTQTRAEGVRVSGKLGYSGHPMIEHYRFLAKHTTRLPKMTIPSPSAMFGRNGRELISQDAYPRDDEFFADLGAAYRKAVRAFADAGCRYLQLDEVYIALLCDPNYRAMQQQRGYDPDALGRIFGDLINAAMSDIPADMTITMHLCRGNFRSTHIGAGGYEPVADLLFNHIKVHGYFMEFDDERSGDFAPLRLVPKDRHVVLGVVTSKKGDLETRDAIRRRVDEAARHVPLDQLCLSPQCGFASTEEGNVLTEQQQWDKLRFVVETAREIWG